MAKGREQLEVLQQTKRGAYLIVQLPELDETKEQPEKTIFSLKKEARIAQETREASGVKLPTGNH